MNEPDIFVTIKRSGFSAVEFLAVEPEELRGALATEIVIHLFSENFKPKRFGTCDCKLLKHDRDNYYYLLNYEPIYGDDARGVYEITVPKIVTLYAVPSLYPFVRDESGTPGHRIVRYSSLEEPQISALREFLNSFGERLVSGSSHREINNALTREFGFDESRTTTLYISGSICFGMSRHRIYLFDLADFLRIDYKFNSKISFVDVPLRFLMYKNDGTTIRLRTT